LRPLQRAAIFLLLIGLDRGKKVFAMMDNSEIKIIVPEINKLTTLSQDLQKSVWTEFKQLGYEATTTSSDVLGMIRSLFGGSKISNQPFH